MSINQPDLDGGSGGPFEGPDGGGVPGTGTGTSAIVTGLPIGENGGVFATTWLLFMPVQDIASGRSYIGFFDADVFDDAKDPSSYSYRQEDVSLNKVPTVHHVRLIYRDLGLATLTVSVKVVNDDGQVKVVSVNTQIGNKIPTGDLLTRIVDIGATGYRPQLKIDRKAGGGPVCITSATMEGEVED
jgi:hypothetical protein